MRTLARGNTVSACEKARDRLKGNGWTPITGIKLDDSLASWGEISYVCVMEMEDDPTKEKKRWNHKFSQWR